MSPRYKGDPRWLQARYPGECDKCGEPFKKGARIFWYPNGRKAYSGRCAEAAAADFNAIAADDVMMSR